MDAALIFANPNKKEHTHLAGADNLFVHPTLNMFDCSRVIIRESVSLKVLVFLASVSAYKKRKFLGICMYI